MNRMMFQVPYSLRESDSWDKASWLSIILRGQQIWRRDNHVLGQYMFASLTSCPFMWYTWANALLLVYKARIKVQDPDSVYNLSHQLREDMPPCSRRSAQTVSEPGVKRSHAVSFWRRHTHSGPQSLVGRPLKYCSSLWVNCKTYPLGTEAMKMYHSIRLFMSFLCIAAQYLYSDGNGHFPVG